MMDVVTLGGVKPLDEVIDRYNEWYLGRVRAAVKAPANPAQLSRRDYFAGLAMQALIPIMPNPSQSADMGQQESQLRLGISWAVLWADAMMQELDKK